MLKNYFGFWTVWQMSTRNLRLLDSVNTAICIWVVLNSLVSTEKQFLLNISTDMLFYYGICKHNGFLIYFSKRFFQTFWKYANIDNDSLKLFLIFTTECDTEKTIAICIQCNQPKFITRGVNVFQKQIVNALLIT